MILSNPCSIAADAPFNIPVFFPGEPVCVIGAGPAGLMAAETLASLGHKVHVFDSMPSVGRKFLLAGKGGLNLTHSEPVPAFQNRFGVAARHLQGALEQFAASEVRQWAASLNVDTFVGTSGRVFPVGLKAAPLLRKWLHRMRHSADHIPVQIHTRHRWRGWNSDGLLEFDQPDGASSMRCSALVLAMGGGSWPQLGSNGLWVKVLQSANVAVAPLKPSNCGFDVEGGWTPHFASRFAGLPFKSVSIEVRRGVESKACEELLFARRGEFVATQTGIEGSLIYAASAILRDAIDMDGKAQIHVDLLPDVELDRVMAELSVPRGSRSYSSHLKSRLGLDGIKAGLLHEHLGPLASCGVEAVARAIKGVPVTLAAARPLAEAISSAGGVAWSGLNDQLMIKDLPGVFCAGEMLDWEAPTGGYLLTACLATGRWVGLGVDRYLCNFDDHQSLAIIKG